MESNKKKRSCKTSSNQYEIYVNEMEKNKAIRERKYTPENPDVLNISWGNLSTKLNAAGGPMKDVTSWKRTFTDWKAHVRKRARLIKISKHETGNKGPPKKPLTNLEERLLNATGRMVVDGLNEIEEFGLPTPSTTVTVDEKLSQVLAPSLNDNKENNEVPDKTKTSKVTTKRPSLLSSFREIAAKPDTDLVTDNLHKIEGHLKNILELERKKYELAKLKMKIKHNIDIYETDDSK